MIPRLYDFDELQFESNGIGPMTDIITCKVTETRNGECLLEATYPTQGIRSKEIAELRFMTAPYDDSNVPQPFLIYKVKRELKTITIYAKHVGMINNNLYIDGTMPESMSVIDRFAQFRTKILDYSYVENGVRIWRYPGHASVLSYYTDIEDMVKTKFKTPVRLRDYIQGADGSIADSLEYGEVQYDKWQLRFTKERGRDSGLVLRYGVNIGDIVGETSSSEAFTGAVIFSTFSDELQYKSYFWRENRESPVGILPNYKLVDLTPKMTAETVFSTRADSRNEAEVLKKQWNIANNITLTGYELSKMAEYAGRLPFRSVKLCDKVKVYYEPLGISSSVKVNKVVWNVLKERYDSLSLGTIKKNLNGTLRDLMLEYGTVR